MFYKLLDAHYFSVSFTEINQECSICPLSAFHTEIYQLSRRNIK